MIGSCVFPTVVKAADGGDRFYRAFEIVVSTKPPDPVDGDVYFQSIGEKGDEFVLHFDARFRDKNSTLTVLSSVRAAVNSRPELREKNIFVYVKSRYIGDLSGASDGLAILIAAMGYTVPANLWATGFVESFTLSEDADVNEIAIRKIDGVSAKLEGARKRGVKLIIPQGDAAQVEPATLLDYAIPVAKFGDVLKVITNA